jgi:hypothetical protein
MDVQTITDWMRRIIAPHQLVELRCLRVGDGTKGGATWNGHFRGHDEVDLMCQAASQLSGLCSGVYFTLNPIRESKFVSKSPRLSACHPNDTATDADIVERRWVLIDVDSKREAGFEKESATDIEKARALGVAHAIREYLTSIDWPSPIIGDSGNGYHLLYRMDALPFTLPLGETDPLRELLHRLADVYDTTGVEIDRKVYNPGRICKFPGTLAMKGSGEGNRPHRISQILD